MRILAFLWLVLAASFSFAQDSQFQVERFKLKLKERRPIGWGGSDPGGRSWTIKDLEGFHQYLDAVATDQGKFELAEWGIPIDCFDAMLALHTLYAYQNGLYIRYNSKLNSIAYYNRPITFLKKILGQIGTQQSHKYTYEVDLWSLKNYQPGIISVIPGSPGHAFYLAQFNGLLPSKIEGPYPAMVTSLNIVYDFEDRKLTNYIDEATGTAGSFRRFPLYSKEEKKSFIPQNYFPSARGDNNEIWWSCVARAQNVNPEIKPLWQNIKNFLTLYRDHQAPLSQLNCRHNSPEVISRFRSPDYPLILKELAGDVCNLIKTRLYKVARGYKNCVLKKNDPKTCSGDTSGLYSTPSFDKNFTSRVSSLRRILNDGYLENQQKEALKLLDFQCPKVNFSEFIIGKCQKLKSLGLKSSCVQPEAQVNADPIYIQVKPYALNKLKRIDLIEPLRDIAHEFESQTSDPKESLEVRWGCQEGDNQLNCLRD